MTVKTTVILGSVIASYLTMGQADAVVNPFAKKPEPKEQATAGVPEDYKNPTSTDIYPYTKKLVSIINSAKSQKEAVNKLCGKSLMSSGLFRQKSGAACKANPDAAMLALSFCFGDPGFDKSDCAQNAKKLLFPGKEMLPLEKLINQPIDATIFSQQIGKDRFAQSFDKKGISHGGGKTIAQWNQYFANPEGFTLEELKGYKETNHSYFLCKSKRENLPQMLRIQANETCYKVPLQGAQKTQPDKSGMAKRGPSLAPMESESQNLGRIKEEGYIAPPSNIQMQGALKGPNEKRDGMFDADQSYSGAVGNIEGRRSSQSREAQSSSTTAGTSPELRKQLLEAGRDAARAQQGLTKSLQPGQTAQAPQPPMTKPAAIPASARKTCSNIASATPKEIRDNVVPVFLDKSNPLNLDADKKNLISRDLDTTNPRFVKRAGEDICKAMSQVSN